MNSLRGDYLGFLKFLTRAKRDIISWFAPHFNDDAQMIALMAAREWDGMDDKEKKYFILATQPDIPRGVKLENAASYRKPRDRQISPLCKVDHWLMQVETGMDHVIKSRTKLHEKYSPMELNVLELLMRAKPTKPVSARSWYSRQNNFDKSLKTSDENWDGIKDQERHIYEACAVLDQKRYKFEKSAWLTKLASFDLTDIYRSLDDFRPPELNYTVRSICSDLQSIGKPIPEKYRRNTKRPREPFSLFIEHHCYEIGYRKGEFRFGDHLKRTSEAWSRLSEEQKEEFKEQSRQLKLARQQEEFKDNEKSFKLIPDDLFKVTKSRTDPPSHPLHLLPTKPRSVVHFYAEFNDIPKPEREESWNSLSTSDKVFYEKMFQELIKSIDDRKVLLLGRVAKIKSLLRETIMLRKLKLELKLINK